MFVYCLLLVFFMRFLSFSCFSNHVHKNVLLLFKFSIKLIVHICHNVPFSLFNYF